MNRIVIDTNIFLYALDPSSHFHTTARKIIDDDSIELFTTTKNISELFAATSKLKKNQNQVFTFYKGIRTYTSVLYPSPESLSILEKLLLKYNPIGNKVFDFEIVSIMLANDIDWIATFNTKDFKGINEIKIFNT